MATRLKRNSLVEAPRHTRHSIGVPQHELTQTEVEFLQELYRTAFTYGLSRLSYQDWCEEKGIDPEESRRCNQRLIDAGVAEATAIGKTMMGITASGIIHLGRNRLADFELAAAQDECRKAILRCGVEEHEKKSSLGLIYVNNLAREVAVPERVLHANLFFLRDLYVIEFHGLNFRLTDHGLDLAAAVAFHDPIEFRWRELCDGGKMSPQARGHALEEVLASLAESEGLDVETRVRSAGEENDLVISRGHDHFLVSCKWKKKRAPNHFLESLRMRLLKRPGSSGCS
jgi:hypothetical protein